MRLFKKRKKKKQKALKEVIDLIIGLYDFYEFNCSKCGVHMNSTEKPQINEICPKCMELEAK